MNNIKILPRFYGNHEQENNAANQLKARFEEELRSIDARGEIIIASSVQLYGQAVRDLDIVILGHLIGYKTQLHSKVRNTNDIVVGPINVEVEVKDFCFVIELKDHEARDITYDNFCLYAKYKDGSTRNVTEQSENQKYALKEFIRINSSVKPPYIVNLIWLRQIETQSQIQKINAINILLKNCSFHDMLQTAVLCGEDFIPKQKKNGFELSSVKPVKTIEIDKLFNYFSEERKKIGTITIRKVQQITTDIIDKQLQKITTDKDITLIKGVAGTGKTSKILRIAYLLQKEENARCLILTYNRALVGDIKRLLAFTDVSDRLDYRTVSIQTMQSFFRQMMLDFGDTLGITFDGNFDEDYKNGLEIVHKYIKENLIDEQEIENVKKRNPELCWDYILVDEAQDWLDEEKEVLMKFYNKGRLIVADGVDQIVRGTIPQNWLVGVDKNCYQESNSNICLRQKNNLVMFDNVLAKKLGISWKVKETPQGMGGGKVIITDKILTENFTKGLLNECVSAGNEAYDMIFFTPPSLVDKNSSGLHHFSLNDQFKNWGIDLFDGTNENTRGSYAKVEQARVYQYDSCRGLEGWVAVCLNFDDFIAYKEEDYVINNRDVENPIVMDTFKDRQKQYVYRWIMMAVTRPVDTLVITLKDGTSRIANILKEIADEFDGSIELKMKEG